MPVWPWLLLLGLLTFIGGATTAWPLLEHLAFVLVALVALCYFLLRMSVRGLHTAVRVSRTRIVAGDEVEETYVFTNDSMWPTLWAEVVDHDFDVEAAGEALGRGQTTVAPHGESTLHRTRVFAHRGWYELGRNTVRVRDPLGLFSNTCQVAEPIEIIVYPRPVAAPEAIQAAREISTSQQRRRLAEADATRGDLREYVPGDAPSRIHWRTSARRGMLMIADPESLQQRGLWLFVDFGGPSADVETVASLAAYLANTLFRSGHPVGALIVGRETDLIPASRERGQLGQILEALARASIVPTSRLDRILESATECEDPGSILMISASPKAHSMATQLRSLCPQVRAVPITTRAVEMPA